MEALGDQSPRRVPGPAVAALLIALAGLVLLAWPAFYVFSTGHVKVWPNAVEGHSPGAAAVVFGPILVAAGAGVVAWRSERWLPLLLGATVLVLPAGLMCAAFFAVNI